MDDGSDHSGGGELIGLLPMAGFGTRIQPLAFSKELFPIGFARDGNGGARPKPVCSYVLEQMRQAGVSRAVIVLRAGKWDLPGYLLDGSRIGLPLAFVVSEGTGSASESLDKAFPFVARARVALGLADIILQPDDVYVRLDRHQRATGADAVLAVMPATDPTKQGMVDFDAAGRVHRVIEKPGATALRYTWAAAVWTPAVTRLLHDRLAEITAATAAQGREASVCEPVQAAIDAGLTVRALVIDDGRYRDIGTPEDLERAIRDYAAGRDGP
jgi:glucose-1-phosphate thymidylyltransferase